MRVSYLAAVVLLSTAVLAGCGGVSTSDTSSGSGSSTVVPSTVAPTTVAPTTVPPATTTVPPATDGSTGSTAPVAGCGAAGLPASPTEQDLPAAVADAREAIVAAATSCDIDGLAGLTAADFTYSFGDAGDPAGFWRTLETQSATTGTVSPLSILARVLEVPYGTIDADGTTIFVWPSAYAYATWEETPQADREALLGVYGAQDLNDFEAFGGYVGYRVGITESGDWIYYVAGD